MKQAKKGDKGGKGGNNDDSAQPTTISATAPGAPAALAALLCLHGTWNWPANRAAEDRLVASLAPGRAAHARHAAAGHHNYSDVACLAPPVMAAMGVVAWRDPVQVRLI